MSLLELIIANIWVKLLDILSIGLKSKSKKITYISYSSDTLPENMKMISKEINEMNTDVNEIYLTLKYKNTFLDKVKYVVEIAKQIYHIKTSGVVIIDGNNFVVSNINKKDTKVVQIWHATGAIKKFGKDYDRKYEIKNYDYIITSSSKSKSIMASAFGVEEKQVVPLGYAKTDKLFDNKKMKKYKTQMLKKYPFLKDKKVVLYAPTFRGEGIYDKDFLDIDINKIGKLLDKDYIFLYKLHPILTHQYENILDVDNVFNVSEESLCKLFSISDMLVSDYSSIIYDYTILEKPIILYTPDLEKYKTSRGLYIDYEDFAPGRIVYSEDELVDQVKREPENIEKVKKLKNDFFDFKDGKSAYRIARFITEIIKE